MWPTTEMRWFYRMTNSMCIPGSLWRWFENLPGTLDDEPERVDHYLLLQEASDLGIKVREGRLEVKYRLARPTRLRLAPQAEGRIEQWAKWAFVAGSNESGPGLKLDFPWQPVRKKRWLRCYRPDHQQSRTLSPEREGQFGCDLELTQVRLEADCWWSLGLEAYGGSVESRHALLRHVAGQTLGSGRPPQLDLRASMGYPRWLELISASV